MRVIPIALANYYPTVCMLGEGSSGILLYIAGACVHIGVIDVLGVEERDESVSEYRGIKINQNLLAAGIKITYNRSN